MRSNNHKKFVYKTIKPGPTRHALWEADAKQHRVLSFCNRKVTTIGRKEKCNYFKIKTSRHPFHKVLSYCSWLHVCTLTTSQLFSCATAENRGLKNALCSRADKQCGLMWKLFAAAD